MPATCNICNNTTYTRIIDSLNSCSICGNWYPIYKCLTCDKYLCSTHLKILT